MGVPSFLASMTYDCFLHKIETEWAFPLFWHKIETEWAFPLFFFVFCFLVACMAFDCFLQR